MRYLSPPGNKGRVEQIDKGFIIKPPASAEKPKPAPKQNSKTNKK